MNFFPSIGKIQSILNLVIFVVSSKCITKLSMTNLRMTKLKSTVVYIILIIFKTFGPAWQRSDSFMVFTSNQNSSFSAAALLVAVAAIEVKLCNSSSLFLLCLLLLLLLSLLLLSVQTILYRKEDFESEM